MGIFFDNGSVLWFNLLPIMIILFLAIEVAIIKFIKKEDKPTDLKYIGFMLMNIVNVIATIITSLMIGGIIDGTIKMFTDNIGTLITIGIVLLIIAIKSMVFVLFIYEKKRK